MLVLFSAVNDPVLAEPRTWHSADGQTVEATWLSYDPSVGAVEIQVVNGGRFVLPVTRLSDADQEWVVEADRARKEAERKLFEELKARAGTRQRFEVVGKHTTSYHAYFPKNYNPENPPPLIIMFSPGGNGRGIISNLIQGCEELGWVAVGVDTLRNRADEQEFTERFDEVLPDILAQIRPNPDRLYMGGFSGGASRAFGYTAAYEQNWRGVLSFGGWLGGSRNPKETAQNMRVAIVNGDGDRGANGWVEHDSKLLKKRKNTVTVITFPGGHVIAPPEVVTEAMKWLQSE